MDIAVKVLYVYQASYNAYEVRNKRWCSNGGFNT
jgi:hypothetical protein